jgi:catechol 2,3-dioxygenase-like lactoylglutathione lyase family enzyme
MSRIRPARFVHVVYRTRQFQKMIAWYCTVFDARVQHQNPVLAFVTYDDEHHRFAFVNLSLVDAEGKAGDARGARGVDHVAYTFDSLRHLLENYAQLKELGIRPYWCLHHGITISLYYADPDHNQMEFQVDCLDNEAANAFMAGPGFAQNPIGVEFDPDQWLAALRAGKSESDYLPRTVHQPVSPIRGNLFDA